MRLGRCSFSECDYLLHYYHVCNDRLRRLMQLSTHCSCSVVCTHECIRMDVTSVKTEFCACCNHLYKRNRKDRTITLPKWCISMKPKKTK